MNKKFTFNISYFFMALALIYVLQGILNNKTTVQISYSEFKTLLADGQVKDLEIGQDVIGGFFSENIKTGKYQNKKKFITNRVDPDLSNMLEKYAVAYTQVVENNLIKDALSWILPTAFFLLIWFFMIKKMSSSQMGGGFMSVGKSKAKVYMEHDTKVTFSDVAGVDEAKSELMEVVDFLKNAKKYSRLGGRMPKGILLVGPPGTGKTLIAKAVAGEANVPFFSISGSEFVEMFVGVGAARVRDLFDQARKSSPCIVFIDELDALGKVRGNSPMGGGHDEKEQTLNQLLTELDGFDSQTGVILLAATNRPDSLDPALLRSGRFDRQVLVDRPDKIGRREILKVHLKKIHFAPTLRIEEIADLTTGFTGADLANLVNEAALVATREEAAEVKLSHFTKAIERIVAGLEKKSRLLNDLERRVVSFHEMGHALVASALKSSDVVHKVSIIPRGMGSLGYTIQRPSEDRYILRKEELEHKISVLLAGRAAEKLIFNHLSTGASDDLVKATDIAKSMVLKYGMVEKLGNVVFLDNQNNFLGTQSNTFSGQHGEETLKLIDDSINEFIQNGYDLALSLLEKNRKVLEESAEQLLSTETLEREDLIPFFERLKY